MAIFLIDKIKQKNSADFALVDSGDIAGGYQSVDTLVNRDSLPTSRRQAGMMVYVAENNKKYILDSNLTTWTEDISGNITKTFNLVDNTVNGSINIADITTDKAVWMYYLIEIVGDNSIKKQGEFRLIITGTSILFDPKDFQQIGGDVGVTFDYDNLQIIGNNVVLKYTTTNIGSNRTMTSSYIKF